MPGRWHLRPFIAVSLLGLVIAFVLITLLSFYAVFRLLIMREVERTNVEAVVNDMLRIEERFQEVEETALTVATNRRLVDRLDDPPADVYDRIVASRELADWLSGIVYVKSYLTSIQIYTDSPLAKAGSRILPMSDVPWEGELVRFREVDAFWISARSDPWASGGPAQVLTFVIKIWNSRNVPIGYVEMNLNERALWESIGGRVDRERGVGRMYVLLDREGRIVSRSPEFDESRLAGTNWLERAALTREGAEVIGGARSKELMVVVRDSTGSRKLVSFVPVGEAFRNMERLRNLVLAVGAVVLMSTLPTAAFISDRVIQPIVRLLEGFKRVETGNFRWRLGPFSIVEFDQLAQSYNAMAEQLQGLLEQLEEEHRKKRDAELRLLQSQIHPHFLYNTLDMINWTAAAKGAVEASEMAAKLARLLRISLGKPEQWIPLDEELEHVSLYAQIQRVRFGDRFEFVDRVTDEFRDLYVPRVILQPLVENAIKHGFDADAGERAQVVVSAVALDEKRFCLMVEDNGKGFAPGSPVRFEQAGGRGIANVHDRIRLYFRAGVRGGVFEPAATRRRRPDRVAGHPVRGRR